MDQQEISDRLELDQLVVRYAMAIDWKDWDLLDTVFTPDAVLDYSSAGGPDAKGPYPQMRQWLQNALAIFPMTMHHLSKTYVQLDGDRAVCWTKLDNPMGLAVDGDGYFDPDGKGLHTFVTGGMYRDTCVRTSGGWRIAEKFLQAQYTQGGFPASRPV